VLLRHFLELRHFPLFPSTHGPLGVPHPVAFVTMLFFAALTDRVFQRSFSPFFSPPPRCFSCYPSVLREGEMVSLFCPLCCLSVSESAPGTFLSRPLGPPQLTLFLFSPLVPAPCRPSLLVNPLPVRSFPFAPFFLLFFPTPSLFVLLWPHFWHPRRRTPSLAEG